VSRPGWGPAGSPGGRAPRQAPQPQGVGGLQGGDSLQAQGSPATAAGKAAVPLTLEGLRVEAAAGLIDTVIIAFTDMQGRLQGKRLTARFFLEEVAGHHA
jgi:hypothetical protein